MDENRLSAWWLGLAPTRQQEVLESPDARPPWLDASLAEEGLADDLAAVDAFVAEKRRERDLSRDAGREPGGAPH